jgi:general secretion pathway protein C
MGRLGIRIANAALFTLCCFQVASVFNEVSADLLMPDSASFASIAPATAQAPRSWAERQAILDRNLFGAQILGEQLALEPEPEDLEETRLPVRLLGTQLSSVREHSKAAISDTSGREHELLHEGDTLAKHPQARLVRIERRRVILQNGALREELLLDEESAVAPTRVQDAMRRSRPPAPLTERLRELQLERTGGRDAKTLFSQAKIIPRWEDGQMVGMELHEVEPGSLWDQVGLKSNDVITSFNGVPLDSAAAGARVLSQFVNAETFEIGLKGGQIINVNATDLLGGAAP